MSALTTGSPVGRGVLDTLPVIAAYVPFGLTVGASMAATGVPVRLAWLSSPVLFGGAGQLLAVQLLAGGASTAIVVLGVLVLNARFLLYGASLAPHVAAWPRPARWAAAYLLADPVYVLAIARFGARDGGGRPRERLAYYLAIGITLWSAWLTLTAVGAAVAPTLPAGLRLDLAAGLTFLLLLLPMLTGRAAYAASAAGGVGALAASGLPLGLGLLCGAAAGITAGALMAAGRRWPRA